MREPGDHVAAARRREEETWTGVSEDWLDAIGESEPLDIGRPLTSGQRVRVFGGYDTNPAWLKDDPDGYEGVVAEFIPGRNELPAAVIDLDVPLFAGGIEGEIVVLEQAWDGIPWGQTSPRVHVELCDFKPEHTRWQDRRRGAWIESHATFEVVEGSAQKSVAVAEVVAVGQSSTSSSFAAECHEGERDSTAACARDGRGTETHLRGAPTGL